jgi:hypothetical protein
MIVPFSFGRSDNIQSAVRFVQPNAKLVMQRYGEGGGGGGLVLLAGAKMYAR